MRINDKGILRMASAVIVCAHVNNARAWADINMDEVVVSAESDYSPKNNLSSTKTDIPVMESPVSINAVDKAVMDDRAATNVSDVAGYVSGVQSLYAAGGTYESFILRGFLNGESNYRNGRMFPLSKFDLANVDRVEVLKGPAASLYGLGDPGGLINVVTKTPAASPHYSLEQSVGSFQYIRTEVGAGGPMGSQKVTYRLDASRTDSDSFRQLVESGRTFVAPIVSVQLSPRTRFNLSYEYSKDSLTYDSGTPAVGAGMADIPRSRTFVQSDLADTHDDHLLDFNATHNFTDKWILAVGATGIDTKDEYEEFYFYSDLNPGDTMGDRYAWFGSGDRDIRIGWANVKGEFQTGGIKHRVLTGADYNRSKGETNTSDIYIDTIDIFNFDPATTHVDENQFKGLPPDFIYRSKSTFSGVYAQDQMTFNERLHVLAGARYDTLKRNLEYAYFSPLESSMRNDSKTSPRFGVLYQAKPWLSVYGNYATSFGPSFQWENSQLLEPETARQYEAGVKAVSFNGNVLSTLAAYDLTKTNIPTPDPNNPALMVAVGKAYSRGIEFDVQGRVTAGLSVIGSYAYTHTEITGDHGGDVGNRLPYVPMQQGSLWLKYAFNPQMERGLSVGSGVIVSGARYGDTANSYKDDGYARLDLFAAYQLPIKKTSLKAQLNVNNVTDEEYYYLRARWTNAPAEPRSVMASLKLEF